MKTPKTPERHGKLLPAALLLLLSAGANAVEIDGKIGAEEWIGAQAFSKFVELQPLTSNKVPSEFHTEAKLLARPEGLAICVWGAGALDGPTTTTDAAGKE